MSITERPSCLINFFIFDISKNLPENEEYKCIVYYYPPDVPQDIQMKEVGKAAAIFKFTQTFNPNGSYRSLSTRFTRQYFLQPEPPFCIAMTLKVPEQLDEQVDYEIHNKVFETLIVHSYKMFRLFMGTMKSALQSSSDIDEELKQLKIRTSYFFSKHLKCMPLETADIADAFLGIQFLPLDKLSFLKVQSLVHSIEQICPCIHFTMVLYQDQIVWSGLCQEDVQLVYNYLITGLFPASMNVSGETRFLTGPVDIKDPSSDRRVPRVFLNHNTPLPDECNLVVYRLSGLTVCLFISSSNELTHEFFITLDNVLGPRVSAMATDVAEQSLLRKNPPSNAVNSDSIRFLYFNHWNMAFKSTLHQSMYGHQRVLHCLPGINLEAIKTCADLSEDFSNWGEGEVIVKTKNDCWIVGKLSNQRELYVVVTRKNVELTDVSDEVRRLRNIIFKDILLLE